MKLSVDLLKPDPDNARKIEDSALEGLAVSAETFGDLSGIVWNEQLGMLVAGHQRMKVLRAAGATEWVRSGDDAYIVHPKTKERFRIRIVKWDEVMHRMAELTANNDRIQGEYTDDVVDQLRALEQETAFDSLRLAEMQLDVDKSLRALQAAQGADNQTAGKLRQTFGIIIECGDEAQQIELLEKLAGEGLSCRPMG